MPSILFRILITTSLLFNVLQNLTPLPQRVCLGNSFPEWSCARQVGATGFAPVISVKDIVASCGSRVYLFSYVSSLQYLTQFNSITTEVCYVTFFIRIGSLRIKPSIHTI